MGLHCCVNICRGIGVDEELIKGSIVVQFVIRGENRKQNRIGRNSVSYSASRSWRRSLGDEAGENSLNQSGSSGGLGADSDGGEI
jgi:hypothetical protein